MNTTLMGLGLTMLLAVGCAHGSAGTSAERDARGTAQVGVAARALVAGPARLVHVTGEKPVRWFIAERTTGSDTDCAAATRSPITESKAARLTIGAGQVLCAAVPAGMTDVSWHQFNDHADTVWALR
jgi:hypothetical protein